MAASQRLKTCNEDEYLFTYCCLVIVKNFRKLTNTADDLCILKLFCKEAHSSHIPIMVIITNATKSKPLYLFNFTFNS